MIHCKSEVARSSAPAEQGSVWIPALLFVLTLVALAAAVWQWQRSVHHEALALQARKAQAVQGALNLNASSAAFEGNRSYPIRAQVQGQWLPASTTFISPRIVQGKSGAWVISVLKYSVNGQVRHIAVHRGWAAQRAAFTAPNLPDASSAAGVQLQGELLAQLPRAYELTKPNLTALGLWPNYDASAYAVLLGVKLEPYVLVLAPNSKDDDASKLLRGNPVDAERQWQGKADKNFGYFVQWLLLAGVGLCGLGWLWRGARTPPAASQDESSGA